MLTNSAEGCAVVRGCRGLGRHLGSVNLPVMLAAVDVTPTDQQIHRGTALFVHVLIYHLFIFTGQKKVTTEDYCD